MNKEGYYKIMKAAVKLIITIMIEVGRVPVDSAFKIGQKIFKNITGKDY